MMLARIVRIPAEGAASFQSFESKVPPLLREYGAALDWRLRSSDGQVEVHVMTFPSQEALDRYREDPVRVGALPAARRVGGDG